MWWWRLKCNPGPVTTKAWPLRAKDQPHFPNCSVIPQQTLRTDCISKDYILQRFSLLWCVKTAAQPKLLFRFPSQSSTPNQSVMLLDSGLALDCVGVKIVQYSLNFESSLRARQKRQRQQEKKTGVFCHCINASVQPISQQSINKSNCHIASLQITHILDHSDADI